MYFRPDPRLVVAESGIPFRLIPGTAGTGTSSRKLPASPGGFVVGVLVQSNFGGVLTVDGARVGEEPGQHYLKEPVAADGSADGSIMSVVATDAPLGARNLQRLAKRAIAGLARSGASMTNGSGDDIISFSTSDDVRRKAGGTSLATSELANDTISPLFQAVAEAAEKAIYNSPLQAESVPGHRGSVEALPIDDVRSLLKSRTQQ